MKSVIVIGAGPAGLAASLAAASQGAHLTLLEQSSRPARKLLASGGGRCNLTNTLALKEMVHRFHSNSDTVFPDRFVRPALKGFAPDALRAFLHNGGLQTDVEQDFFVYPHSRKAADVLSVWLQSCRKAGAYLKTGCDVRSFLMKDKIISALETQDGRIPCDAVVLATGGKGYPALGGNEGGYRLARQCGHTIIEPLPALTSLEIQDHWLAPCAGVTLKNVILKVKCAGQKPVSFGGDMLITHTGISGPAALNSAAVVFRLMHETNQCARVELCLDCGADAAQWRDRFIVWQQKQGNKSISALLTADLPRSIVSAIFNRLTIPQELKAAELKKDQRTSLIGMLTALPLTVEATGDFDKAMVTSGGVELSEINPKTMQSRLIQNLFFCGEIVDIDGPCGGFNLQWAFSSGRLAGVSVVR